MNLSFKDTQFIIEGLKVLSQTYNERIQELEHKEDSEDELADLGNDRMFLESLCHELEKNVNNQSLARLRIHEKDQLLQAILRLSIPEKLLLVEAITESIRKEYDLMVP